MINKRFLNFKTYNGFLAKKDQIAEDSIVFIQDKPCIWARGKEYVCDGPYSAKATDGLFQFKNGNNEVIFTISQNNGILTLTDSKGNTIDTEYVSKLQFDAAKRETNQKIANIENSKASKIDIATLATQNDIVDSLAEYQRKLIAGSGIRINANEEISCTLDTDVYEVVDEFPTGDDINPNKFYIKQEQSGNDTIFVQYKWDSELQDWVSFGRVQPTISLEKYITRDEAARSFAPRGSYVTTTQFERTVDAIDEMFANIDYASSSDISDIYQQMSNYLTASDLNGYVTTEDLLELRQFVVDNYVHNSRLYTLKEGDGEDENPGESTGSSSTIQPSTGGTTIINNTITVDTELSLSSSNPLANWAIYAALRKKVDSTVLPELARKTDLNTKADTSLLNNYVTKDSLNNSLNNKQDTLTAGPGISIEDGQISVTLDTKPFIIVDELPTTNIDENKIYILREIVDGETVYVEFRRINNTWQEVGTKQLSVDLDGYYTKSESDQRYLIAEGTYLTTTEAQQTYQPKRDDYVVSEDISKLLTDIADIYQEKGDFALRQDVADALTRLQQVIDQKYVLKADVYYNQDVDWSSSTPVDIPVNQSDNGSSDDEPSSGGSNCDCSSKMVTLTASQYAQLVEDNLVQQDVYYFTYEGEAPSAGWQFGGAFPITFTENWAFGQAFPITLN